MRNRHFIQGLLALSIILALSLPTGAQDNIAGEILWRVNELRQRGGMSPLIWNGSLYTAAQRHSDDMAAMDLLTHTGQDGSQFWQRMQAAGYSLTTGAENVLSRPDTDGAGAFGQWEASTPHRANMVNPQYQEIGIGYAQSATGTYYFTMVLGARADFSPPAQAPPPTATSQPQPVVQPSPLPATVAPTISPPTASPITPTPIMPTATSDARVATLRSPLPTNTPGAPVATITPGGAVALVPTNAPSGPVAAPPTNNDDLRLLYDFDTFTLINTSGRSLNLSGLIFESLSGAFRAEGWYIPELSQDLRSFAPDGCLQLIAPSGQVGSPPAACETRHAWVRINDQRLFWQGVDAFSVRNGEQPLGRCFARAGICDLSLRQETIAADAEIAASPVDLRVEIGPGNVALINVSGRALNLLGLRFESDTATLEIERWDTEFLTQPLSFFSPGDCLQVWGLASEVLPAPETCRIRHGWIAVNDDASFWRDTSAFAVSLNGQRLATCPTEFRACEVSLSGEHTGSAFPGPDAVPEPTAISQPDFHAELRIFTDENGVILLNTSGRPLDLNNLVFESDAGVFAATRWATQDLSRPLSAFPGGDCLQAWNVGGEFQPRPEACELRHGWVAVAAEAQFWNGAVTFRVRRGGEVMGNCETRAAFCDVPWP